MGHYLNRIKNSPVLVRTVPFGLFVALTFCQGRFFETSAYWIYSLKTIVGAGLVWSIWKWIPEMRWKISWEAVLAGVLVFVVWVGLDPFYPKLLGESPPWNPFAIYGDQSPLAWTFVVIRLLGSTLVVPCLEEVFYRSFLYRWIVRPDFESVPLSYAAWKPFVLAGAIFGAAHFEWLAGILCAWVYQGLVCRKGRLGDAITAHAITNFLLGLYVVGRGAWHFW